MNNIWNELSEESKDYVRKIFNEYEPVCSEDLVRMNLMSDLFGKENLNPKSQIKTWEDYLETIKDEQAQSLTGELDKVSLDSGYVDKDSPVFRKVIATFKIAKLIEVAYGGIITNEEWADINKIKYSIWYHVEHKKFITDYGYSSKEFLAFHTAEQRDEFLKNNKSLCRDYFMIN